MADEIVGSPFSRPAWRVEPHFWDDTDRTANYVLVLDTLNFSFWGEPKWRVDWRGRSYDGYWALAAALRRALEAGEPILEAAYLAGCDQSTLAYLLRGEGVPPMLGARATALRQAGQTLLDHYGGSFARFVRERGDGSAIALVRHLVAELPSFDDRVRFAGREVRFFKRAQLLVSDLHGAFDGRGLGAFRDLDALTAFADYKLPQVLRELGVLQYAESLAAHVDSRQELPPGSREEVEIRAGTVWAVEELRRELERRGVQARAFELDWHLWSLGQTLPMRHPHHRTRTIYY